MSCECAFYSKPCPWKYIEKDDVVATSPNSSAFNPSNDNCDNIYENIIKINCEDSAIKRSNIGHTIISVFRYYIYVVPMVDISI